MQTAKGQDTGQEDTIQAIGWVVESDIWEREMPSEVTREELDTAIAKAEREFHDTTRSVFGPPEVPPVFPGTASRVRVLPANPWGWTNLVR